MTPRVCTDKVATCAHELGRLSVRELRDAAEVRVRQSWCCAERGTQRRPGERAAIEEIEVLQARARRRER